MSPGVTWEEGPRAGSGCRLQWYPSPFTLLYLKALNGLLSLPVWLELSLWALCSTSFHCQHLSPSLGIYSIQSFLFWTVYMKAQLGSAQKTNFLLNSIQPFYILSACFQTTNFWWTWTNLSFRNKAEQRLSRIHLAKWEWWDSGQNQSSRNVCECVWVIRGMWAGSLKLLGMHGSGCGISLWVWHVGQRKMKI